MPPVPEPLPLEIDGPTFQRMGSLLLSRLDQWLRTPRPAMRTDGSQRAARRLDEPPPEAPVSFSRLLSRLFGEVIEPGLDTSGAGYLAFIPGGGLPQSALADLLTDVTNRYTGLWKPAPALVQLEVTVVRWLCSFVGFDAPEAGGLLTSGGSMANLCAVVAAREASGEKRLDRLRVYCTAQAHHSVLKALRTAGLSVEQLVTVPHDAAFRLDPIALAEKMHQDRVAGAVPFLVVANAGCTPVGAVDPLPAIADVCAQQDAWFHVDGAYGGAFVLTKRGSVVLDGIQRADSITLDPHKGFFLPYGTGAVLVRDRETLRRAFSVSASYLPQPDGHADHWDFADFGPELTRPARGLRLWLPLKLHGVGAFRDALDEKLDLAQQAHDSIAALPWVRIVVPPTLSLFAFRVEAPGHDGDVLTRRVLSAVGRKKRVVITGAQVFDPAVGTMVFVGRVCVLSFRTHAAHIAHLVEDVEASIRALVETGAHKGGPVE